MLAVVTNGILLLLLAWGIRYNIHCCVSYRRSIFNWTWFCLYNPYKICLDIDIPISHQWLVYCPTTNEDGNTFSNQSNKSSWPMGDLLITITTEMWPTTSLKLRSSVSTLWGLCAFYRIIVKSFQQNSETSVWTVYLVDSWMRWTSNRWNRYDVANNIVIQV